jgi:hypothetical protein
MAQQRNDEPEEYLDLKTEDAEEEEEHQNDPILQPAVRNHELILAEADIANPTATFW